MIVIDALPYVNWDRTILKALGESSGMLGFSLYQFQLKNGSNCKLEDFCAMVHKTADLMDIDYIGIGSDLCRHWDYSTSEQMRSSRWTIDPNFGEGSSAKPLWPDQPSWFESTSDIKNIAFGLADSGFSDSEFPKIMGGNWYAFFDKSIGSLTATQS